MVFYYAFDREMLNLIGFNDLVVESRKAIEKIIERDLKFLVFVIPLDEKIVVSPSFRYESVLFRNIISKNRAFTEAGVIAEYRREADQKDFWLKKSENYKSAMEISDDYREAYGSETFYKSVSGIWIERVPKNKIIGQVSRDMFMLNVRERGKQNEIPSHLIEEVLHITEETREDTFLWEMENHMLRKYNVPDKIIRETGVRELMNSSYLDVFSEQNISICVPSLGNLSFRNREGSYNMWTIGALLERYDIKELIGSMSAEEILRIRRNADLQEMLKTVREGVKKGLRMEEIYNEVKQFGDMGRLIRMLTFTNENMNIEMKKEDNMFRDDSKILLHLSDLHFTDYKEMNDHYYYLKLDLHNNMKIDNVDFLVISGDVCDRPKKEMYQAAVEFVHKLSQEFSIPKEKMMFVIGNHDCDQDISEKSYDDQGEKIIDQVSYQSRFDSYSKFFYEPLKGRPYNSDPDQQVDSCIFEDANLYVLGLNSSYQIDHQNTFKSAINMTAIQNSGAEDRKYDDFMKLLVWHHPIIGSGSIQDTTFMDTLAVIGFRACMHGHIHEASNGSFKYDENRQICMIGAGTFGAVQKERGDGIPRQYNLVEVDKNERQLIVHTRKREKDNGMWEADARWGNKNKKPDDYYVVKM